MPAFNLPPTSAGSIETRTQLPTTFGTPTFLAPRNTRNQLPVLPTRTSALAVLDAAAVRLGLGGSYRLALANRCQGTVDVVDQAASGR